VRAQGPGVLNPQQLSFTVAKKSKKA
jgi:hypothetical protein